MSIIPFFFLVFPFSFFSLSLPYLFFHANTDLHRTALIFFNLRCNTCLSSNLHGSTTTRCKCCASARPRRRPASRLRLRVAVRRPLPPCSRRCGSRGLAPDGQRPRAAAPHPAALHPAAPARPDEGKSGLRLALGPRQLAEPGEASFFGSHLSPLLSAHIPRLPAWSEAICTRLAGGKAKLLLELVQERYQTGPKRKV